MANLPVHKRLTWTREHHRLCLHKRDTTSCLPFRANLGTNSTRSTLACDTICAPFTISPALPLHKCLPSSSMIGSRRSWLFLLLAIIACVHANNKQEELPPVPPEALPIELTKDNFTEYFTGLPETRWVLLEYYAHWWCVLNSPRPSALSPQPACAALFL
jgi:hypothetical protein